MFGQSSWFRFSERWFSMRPLTWQGWAYLAAWGAAIVIPSYWLWSVDKSMESMVWLGAACAGSAYDVFMMRKQLTNQVSDPTITRYSSPAPIAATVDVRTTRDDVLYIDDTPTAAEMLNVRYARQDRRA